MEKTGRQWAITEHMTLNGSDYRPQEVKGLLTNALNSGTGYGFEFVNLSNSSKGAFSLYNDDWSPKPLIAEVDEKWAEWLQTVEARFPRN